MKYLKITTTGNIFLDDYLKCKLEQTELSREITYLLINIRNFSDETGKAKMPKRIPGSLVIGYESALKNGLIEVVEEMDVLDSALRVVNKKWKEWDKKEKDSAFRAGLGPPPDIFGDFSGEDEEDYGD